MIASGLSIFLLIVVVNSFVSERASTQQLAPNVRLMAGVEHVNVYRVIGKDHDCYVVLGGNSPGISCVKR